MKIIKGKSFMIKLGIKSEVKIRGKKIEAFKFLKIQFLQKDLVLFQNHKKSIST